MVVDEHIDIVI